MGSLYLYMQVGFWTYTYKYLRVFCWVCGKYSLTYLIETREVCYFMISRYFPLLDNYVCYYTYLQFA